MNKTTLTIVLVLFFGLFLGQNAMAQQAVKTKITSEKEVKASTTDKDVSQAKPQLKDSKSAANPAKPCCSSAKKADCAKKTECAKTSDKKCCDKSKTECTKTKVRTTEKSTDKK